MHLAIQQAAKLDALTEPFCTRYHHEDGKVRTGMFTYVPEAKIEEYERRAWLGVQIMAGPTHGFYSLLMWHCECGEVQP